ncbi:hypothetical protein, partial [Sandarakinorhabdus sp.]|uniref:hypothetical protein n=1 Tax=Sandarakinorhabdus sp. TaxID=1916663 RepID=UPI00333E5A74
MTSTGAAAAIMRTVRLIWHIRSQIDLPTGLDAAAAIDRLAPLLDTAGTSTKRTDDSLIFTKKDPASQDKLAAFNAGSLRIASTAAGQVLKFDLTSRFMLACFAAPLLFLAFAQIALVTGAYQKAEAEAAEKLEKAKEAKEKAKKKAEKPDAKELPRNPIDVALGAPPPKTKKEREAEKLKQKDEPVSATPHYVFAGFFAALYLIGRFLEQRLARNLFKKA